MPEGVFESELFGHIKGAFTDAKTDRAGSPRWPTRALFLDEIANISAAHKLRVLETGEFERVGSSKTRKVNVRIISATNSDLHAEVATGRFRQDLLFRLNTVEIRVPALRDRREDIPLLANHFLKLHSEHYRKLVTSFDPAAMNALSEHHWRGNVRELDHAVERAILMARGRSSRPATWASINLGQLGAARRHEPGRGRMLPDQKDAGPLRRQRQQGRRSPEPQRPLSPAGEIRTLTIADGLRIADLRTQ